MDRVRSSTGTAGLPSAARATRRSPARGPPARPPPAIRSRRQRAPPARPRGRHQPGDLPQGATGGPVRRWAAAPARDDAPARSPRPPLPAACAGLRRVRPREVGGHRGHHLGGLGDRPGAAGAAAEVGGEDRLVLRLERVQRPADGELVEGLVVLGLVVRASGPLSDRPLGGRPGSAGSAPGRRQRAAQFLLEPPHPGQHPGLHRAEGRPSARRPRAGCTRRSRRA